MQALINNAAGPVALTLLSLAAFALVPALAVGIGGDWFDADTELPISGVDSFAVDGEGNIYLAIGTYNHIQKYDREGRFVTHWPVPSGTGTFSLRVGTYETIDAIAWRRKRVYRYAPDGQLIATQPINPLVQAQFQNLSARITSPDGTTYRLSSPYWWPAVHRAEPGAPERTIIETRFTMWIRSVPFPALPLGIAGVALLGVFLSSVNRREPAV